MAATRILLSLAVLTMLLAAPLASPGVGDGGVPAVIDPALAERHRGDVRLLLVFDGPVTERRVADVEAAGGVVQGVMRTVPVVHAYAPADSLDRLARVPGVIAIEEDRPLRPALDVAAAAVRARESKAYDLTAWEDLGVTGAGIVVAIVDSGVSNRHASLAGRIAAYADCSKACATVADPEDTDSIGHGTHVAGIVGGQDGTYKGVAFGARIADVKVGTDVVGVAVETFLSGIQRALQWIIDHNAASSPQDRIRVVNISYGGQGDRPDDGSDSTSRMVDAAVEAGIVVVVSAGNCGPDGDQTCMRTADSNTVGSPGAAKGAITVGAVEDRNTPERSDDALAGYSSRGPNGGEPKPNVVAPGSVITSSTNIGNSFTALSGTSFSSPLVAGIVALVLEANPALTPAKVKDVLQRSAEDIPPAGWDKDTGWGYADAYAAVDLALRLRGSATEPPGGNAPPLADVGGPYRGTAGRIIAFDATRSKDPDGEIVRFDWDFEADGKVDAATNAPRIGHVYDEAGTYRVALTVTDDDGAVARDEAAVVIAEPGSPPPKGPPPEENGTGEPPPDEEPQGFDAPEIPGAGLVSVAVAGLLAAALSRRCRYK